MDRDTRAFRMGTSQAADSPDFVVAAIYEQALVNNEKQKTTHILNDNGV
jgi:hypothetical protein